MSTRMKPVRYRVTISHTNVDTTQEDAVQTVLTNVGSIRISQYRYVRTGGTAANYRPRIGESAAWTDDDIDEVITFASTAVGTRIGQVFDPPVEVRLDSSGQFHHRPGFDAGADNDGDAVIWYEVVS